MADADAEAAFLSSMQALNESGGDYHDTTGGASQMQIESSSDEYDPSQEVQDVSFSPGAQGSADQAVSVDSLNTLHPRLSSVSPHSAMKSLIPPNSDPNGVTIAAPAMMGQSRSYSVGSVNSIDKPPPLQNSQSNLTTGETYSPSNREEQYSGVDSLFDANKISRLEAHSSSNTPLPASTGHTLDLDTFQKHSASVVPQSVSTSTVPNSAAVLTSAGAAMHGENMARPSSTLSTPQLKETQRATDHPKSSYTLATPKTRLPHDTVGLLEDRIKEDSRGDVDAWLSLIREHRQRGKLSDARKTYERFFTIFPSAAEQWVEYAKMENEAQNRNGMETIFNNTLLNIPNIQLWSLYLDHIRRHNNVTTDTSGSARQIIYQAYDLALKNIGIDKDSGKLWQDYIQFLKSGPGNIGGSSWQDQQKMDQLRKAYQRAICIPMKSVETLWKEYDKFEMGLNKTTGRKFLQDHSPAYMSAKSSAIELRNITSNLDRTTLPVLPPALGFEGDVEYMKQLDIWKRWIQWEKDDPLVLKQEDISAYRDRIVFVYRQALMAMRFWPELWFDAAQFCFDSSLETEGNEFLTQGISANPESCLLAFKRADRLELTTVGEESDESIKRRGATVREPYDGVLNALYDLITRLSNRETQDIGRIEAQFAEEKEKRLNGTRDEEDDRDLEAEEAQSREKRKQMQIEAVKTVNAVQTRLLQKTITHAWIALMRAMRRVQGKGKINEAIGGSRQIFTDARKRGRVLSDVYVASALIEFHCYDAEAAKKIFERGVKLFPDDEGFSLEYIKHLTVTNDHTNARVVFDTAVGRFAQKPETLAKAKPLYAFFHDHESRYGELSQVMKLEKRMGDLFPEDPKLTLFSRRFANSGFDPTAVRPIVSPNTQAKPKSIFREETPQAAQTTPQTLSAHVANSPKRPLPVDAESDNDSTRPRKLARGESPLKGAAGRRLDQQKRSRPPHESYQYESQSLPPAPAPPPLPRDVTFLLSIIPKAATYHATRFKAENLVRLLRDIPLPNSVSQLPASSIARMQQIQPVQPLQQMPGVPPSQFNGYYGFNR